jgi:phosphosulfolactate phosphohydrolase-like enzyme
MKSRQIEMLLKALSNSDLKVKKISTDNYFSLICIKRNLQKIIEDIVTAEEGLAKEYGVIFGTTNTPDTEFVNKLREIQQKEHEVTGLNFMSKEEFKTWVDDVDFETSSILAEYILKP